MSLIVLVGLGLGIGSFVNGAAKRASPSNFAVVISCLLAGVVGVVLVYLGWTLGLWGMVFFGALGAAYIIHPLAIQGMVRQPNSKLPFLVSCAISAWWLYYLFHPPG